MSPPLPLRVHTRTCSRIRIRRAGPLIAATTSLTVGLGIVAAVDPERPGHYPVCPFLFLTGYYCPACGSLRAVHALLHGDPMLAMHRNPLLVAALPLLVAGYVWWGRRLVLGGPPRSRPMPRWASWGLPAVLIAFGVLRNLPALSWLAP
jgi:hypothetical protein